LKKASLAEAYVHHFLSGVMAQSTPDARAATHLWNKNGAYAAKQEQAV